MAGQRELTSWPCWVAQRFYWQQLGILVAVAVTYYVLNSLLTHAVVSLTAERSLWSVIVGNSQYALVPELGMIIVGELLALLWASRPLWSLAIILPAVVTYRTLDYVRRLQTETEGAVVALADIIDNRDRYTYLHSHRVAAYSNPPSQPPLLSTESPSLSYHTHAGPQAGTCYLARLGLPSPTAGNTERTVAVSSRRRVLALAYHRASLAAGAHACTRSKHQLSLRCKQSALSPLSGPGAAANALAPR